MAASDLTDRARRAEDAYRSRDAELIARAREAAAHQAPSEETRALQAALGLDDTKARSLQAGVDAKDQHQAAYQRIE